MDKLDGRITQEFFDQHVAEWRREQDGLLRKIHDILTATPAPIDQAVDIMRLTSRASELFMQQLRAPGTVRAPSTAECPMNDAVQWIESSAIGLRFKVLVCIHDFSADVCRGIQICLGSELVPRDETLNGSAIEPQHRSGSPPVSSVLVQHKL